MTLAAWLLLASLVIALIALGITLLNLARYRPPALTTRPTTLNSDAPSPGSPRPLVNVCIPARNEQENIEPCIRSLLANDYPELRILVYDDQSDDATPAILGRLAAADRRIRIVPTHDLPDGWNGKQWACDRMGRYAAANRPGGDEGPDTSWLLFTDADVRFGPRAVSSTVAEAQRTGADLLSTFPRQITGTLGESLLIPLIHFLLLSYLPIGRMRKTLEPSASAGCGQFLFVRTAAWAESGGHAAFRDSMHDGIKMPRALRRAGFRTDLFDGTEHVSCRMYRGLGATWRGFAKNAFEGLGSVALLALITVLHLLGHVIPWAYLAGAAVWGVNDPAAAGLAGGAVGVALTQRLILARRFRQSILSTVLHPIGVLLMTAVQWHSFILHVTGLRAWRGRTQRPAQSRARSSPAPECAAR